MNLFDLFVKISADTNDADRGISSVGEKMESLAKQASSAVSAVASAAGAIGSAVAGASSAVVSLGSTLQNIGNQSVKTFIDSVSALGSTVAEVDSAVSGIGSNFTKILGAASAAAGGFAVSLAKTGVEFNSQMEQYRAAFNTILGSAEETDAALAQIKADAAATPFDVAGLVRANQLLLSTGLSASESRDIVLALGDAIAATGGGNDEINRMSVNLQQIKNMGRAMTIDLRQFALAGIDIYGILAEYTGDSIADIMDKDYVVSWEAVSGALKMATSEGGKYFNAMAAQSKTFKGQISNLQDNWTSLLGSVTEGLQEILKDEALQKIINYVDELQGAMDDGGLSAAVEALGDIFADAVSTMLNYIPQLADGATSALVSLFTSIDIKQLSGSLAALIETLFSSVDDLAEVIIPLIGELVPDILSAFMRYQGVVREIGISLITTIAESISNNKQLLWDSLVSTVGGVADALYINLPKFTDAGIDILAALVDGITANADLFGSSIAAILSDSLMRIGDVLPGLISGAAGIVTSLFGSIDLSGILPAIVSTFDAVIAAMGDISTSLMPLVEQIVSGLAGSFIQYEGKLIEIGMQIVTAVAKGIRDNPDGINSALFSALGGISAGVASAVPEIVGAGKSILSALAQGMEQNSEEISVGLGSVLAEISQFFSNDLPEIADAGRRIVLVISQAISNNADGIDAAAQSIVDFVADSISGADFGEFANTAVTLLSRLVDFIRENLPTLIPAATEAISQFATSLTTPDNLTKLADSAMNIVAELVNQIMFASTDLSAAAAECVINFATWIINPQNQLESIRAGKAMVEKIAQGISENNDKVITEAKNLINRIRENLEGAEWLSTGQKIVAEILNGLKAAWGTLTDWVNSRIQELCNLGGAIVAGLKSGIEEGAKNIKDVASSLGDLVQEALKKKLEVHSPSKVMERIGEFTVDGFISGWESRFADLRSMVENDASLIAQTSYNTIPREKSEAYVASRIAQDFSGVGAGTYTINVQIDSQTIASAVFDPLRAESKRRGETIA